MRIGKGQEDMRGRKKHVGIADGDFDRVIGCGRLAPNQFVNACAGKPVSFSKFPGQRFQAVDYEKAILEQGDLEAVLSSDRGCALVNTEPGLRRTSSESRNLSKAHLSKCRALHRADTESLDPHKKTEIRRWRYFAQS